MLWVVALYGTALSFDLSWRFDIPKTKTSVVNKVCYPVAVTDISDSLSVSQLP